MKQLQWEMHCKYLGSDKHLYGGGLHVIIHKLLTGTAQQNMVHTWNILKQIYDTLDIKTRCGVMKVTMFKRNIAGLPDLMGRATEIKHLSKALLVLWDRGRTIGDRLHDYIYTALEASYKLDEILDLHRGEYDLPAEAAQRFIKYALQYCQACQAWAEDLEHAEAPPVHVGIVPTPEDAEATPVDVAIVPQEPEVPAVPAEEPPVHDFIVPPVPPVLAVQVPDHEQVYNLIVENIIIDAFGNLQENSLNQWRRLRALENVNRKSAKKFLRAMDVTNRED